MITCIGHITLDKIVIPHRPTVHMPGGTAFYFAYGMEALGATPEDFKLITSVAPSEMATVDEMRRRGLNVEVIPSPTSVYFENIYGENQNERHQRVLAKAQPFTVDNLAGAESQIFHLGTLLADDFSVDVVKMLSQRGIVSADAQGYLREVRDHKVYAVDWEEKREALKHISIIKANEMEMAVIAGTDDPREAARRLAKWGAKEVLLTFGDHGSLIYTDGEFYNVPVFPTPLVVDATGCGDTYMTGYLYRRAQGASPLQSGEFAAAMCTLKLGYSGPFHNTVAEIERVEAEKQLKIF